jgi:hypothetical protein
VRPLRDPAAARDIDGRDEHQRAGGEDFLGHAGMRGAIEPALRQRHVSRRRHEFTELRIGHLVAIDPEAFKAHNVREALLRSVALEPMMKVPPRMKTIPAVPLSSDGRPE